MEDNLMLFQGKLSVVSGASCPRVNPPADMSLALMAEYEMAATTLDTAYRSPISLPWSVKEYLEHLPPRPNGFIGAVEDKLESLFPPMHSPPYPLISDPTTIVDLHGCILSWYLPGCLSRERQTIIWNAATTIQPFFKGGKKDGIWRNLDIFYKPWEDCISSAPGQVLFSPNWFEQARDGPEHDLKPSVTLRPENLHRGGAGWLTAMAEASTLLSSILRVIHPELFFMGLETMKKMGSNGDPPDVLRLWYSLFNGVQVISNRETPVHRDHNSRWEWYDLLTTVGPYNNAILAFPGIGLRFQYNSGTVLGICGRVIRHGVSEAEGERICVAYFMRENVQKRMGTKYASWNKWDSYRECDVDM